MADDERHFGKERSANDNHVPDGRDAGGEADASERLDRMVLTIARLIGRQIAREHFKALHAANDNAPLTGDEPDGEDT